MDLGIISVACKSIVKTSFEILEVCVFENCLVLNEMLILFDSNKYSDPLLSSNTWISLATLSYPNTLLILIFK